MKWSIDLDEMKGKSSAHYRRIAHSGASACSAHRGDPVPGAVRRDRRARDTLRRQRERPARLLARQRHAFSARATQEGVVYAGAHPSGWDLAHGSPSPSSPACAPPLAPAHTKPEADTFKSGQNRSPATPSSYRIRPTIRTRATSQEAICHEGGGSESGRKISGPVWVVSDLDAGLPARRGYRRGAMGARDVTGGESPVSIPGSAVS